MQIDRLNFLAERLLARPLRPEELAIVRGSLEKFEKHYAAQAEDAKKLVAVGESKAEAKAADAATGCVDDGRQRADESR